MTRRRDLPRPCDPAVISRDVDARLRHGHATLVATGGQALARRDELSLPQRRAIANALDDCNDKIKKELDEGEPR